MTRPRKFAPPSRPVPAPRKHRKPARPPYRLRGLEPLEDRAVPAVTLIPDGARFIVRFTEDVAGTNDTLQLSATNGGLLQYSLNGAPFSTDLDSGTPGVQAQLLTAISRTDVLFGAGDDVLSVDGTTNPGVIPAPGGIVFTAGPGNDRLDVTINQDMTLTASAFTTGGRTITFTDLEAARLTGGNGNSLLDASAFPNPVTLDGGTGKDTLIGGTGDDILLGVAGGDLMEGGAGNDQLFSGNTGTTMIGGTGDDTLNGGNGADQMFGEDGNDFLIGGNGADSMDGGAGNDTFSGGLGNDTAAGGSGTDQVIGNNDIDWTLTDNTLTGEGTDILQSIEQAQLTGGGRDNALNAAGFSGQVTLDGGGGNDTLTGGTGQNVFNRPVGEVGNITIIGGPAGSTNDYFLWLQGAIRITSPGGFDRLTFLSPVTLDLNITDGTPQVVDKAGSTVALTGFFEQCLGSPFDDRVTAASNTTIQGGSGKDTLIANGKTNVVMAGDDGVDTLISQGGTDISMIGGADADTLQQQGGTNISMSGESDADTLLSSGGSHITISGGADVDTLQQQGGTQIMMAGDDGVDTLISQGGTNISMIGGTGGDALIQQGGTKVTMSGGADADSLVSAAGSHITIAGDDGDDRLTIKEGADETVSGGTGNDTYVFAGASLGSVVVDEQALPGPVADLSQDTLDFSGYTGGPINLSLASTAAQTLGSGLTLTFTDGSGIENVIGTAGADTVTGNGRDNLLVGADQLDAPTGPAPGWNGRTQVVFLDFDTFTQFPEHVYTQAERDAIQARLVADYIGPDPAHPWFHFQFTQSLPASGPFARLNFNQTPSEAEDSNQLTGGFAHELDFRNLNLGTGDDPSFASIQVNGILGVSGQPDDTTENWIRLSAKIAAHELGHLVGLLHTDSYGPIGSGPHAPPGGARYNPDYTGPAAGFETFDNIMSSPAFAGSDRFNDLRDLYFGERDAVKLEFAESGTVVPEQSAAHGGFNAAMPIALAPLAVPNTLGAGALNAPKAFTVAALDVVGSINLDSGTGASEGDFYSLTGRKGDLFNIEVLSRNLTRLTHTSNPNDIVPITDPNVIDPIVRVYDAAHNLVAYYTASAADDDGPESTDASIVDLTLPADGTYYVEVDTFTSGTVPDTDVGQYELFMYRFDAGNPTDGGDVLDGAGGNDSLVGGLGNDVLTGGLGNDAMKGGSGNDTYVNPAAGADSVIEESGRDTLDFSTAATGVTVSLALDAGQTQAVTTAGDTLAITGTLEIGLGTAFADSITGNAADNVLNGGTGNDTLRGGAGNDIQIGGAGNDTIDGEADNDFLIGGLGSDVLQGSGGDDILIGGQTTYDANQPALDSIMAEWTGPSTYGQRVAHVTGTAGGLNGTTYLIKLTTVLDDSKIGDTLTGGLGLDLFFGFTQDKVTDRQAPTETSL